MSYDSHLYKEDILGSIAFASANAKPGIIPNDDFPGMETGSREAMREQEAGTLFINSSDEDLGQLHLFGCSVQCGWCDRSRSILLTSVDSTKCLARTSLASHTGRSQNEQVVLDMRMWLRECILVRACSGNSLVSMADAILPCFCG